MMKPIITIRKPSRSARQEPAVHLFAIGQVVRLKSGFVAQAFHGDLYRVTGRLPAQGDSLQYRIRNDDERHERVTTQDNLEAMDPSQSGSHEALLERTFRHV